MRSFQIYGIWPHFRNAVWLACVHIPNARLHEITIILTTVGLAQARPNYTLEHDMLGFVVYSLLTSNLLCKYGSLSQEPYSNSECTLYYVFQLFT